MNVWQCPGPTRTLSALVDALLEGRSVIVRRPGLAPDDAEGELARLMETFGWMLRHLDDSGAVPARQVLEAAGLTEALSQTATPDRLLTGELAGQAYWIQPNGEAGRSRWLSFLEGYTAACRSASGADGPRFVLALDGALGEPEPAKQVGIDLVDLGRSVTTTDLALIAFHHVGTRFGASLKGQVIAQVATSLARWDPHLLLRLLDEPPEVLFDPAGLLLSYAREHGWSPEAAPCWKDGSLRRYIRREEIHSAWLPFHDPGKEIPSRVWAGQAAVLMPAIERRRIEIIDRHRAVLAAQLPIETDYSVIRDPSDLDIGPLYFLLSKLKLPSQSRALRLKDARNNLAHLDPLTASDAFATEITGDEI